MDELLVLSHCNFKAMLLLTEMYFSRLPSRLVVLDQPHEARRIYLHQP